MKTEKFTIKDLFPDMDLDQRAALGREVIKKYKTWYNGSLPERTIENHFGQKSLVCFYDKEKKGMNFMKEVKDMSNQLVYDKSKKKWLRKRKKHEATK